MMDEDEHLAVRRGAEHIRVEGATEELGEIVPAPVVTEDQTVRIDRGRDDERERR
jgi:hypothetical protein